MLRVTLVLALFATACGGYQGVRAPQLTPSDSRWERVLQRQARTELGCREVRLIPLGEAVIQADGCMRVAEYALFCYGRRSCDWRMLEGVARHAERDLSCAAAAISISAPGPLQRSAIGCGRSVAYTLTCSAEHCAWSPNAAPASAAPIEVVAVGSTTDGVVIPPPPGSTTSGEEAVVPPPTGAGSTDEVVIPPPPGSEPPPPTSGGGATDDVVIPPPPT